MEKVRLPTKKKYFLIMIFAFGLILSLLLALLLDKTLQPQSNVAQNISSMNGPVIFYPGRSGGFPIIKSDDGSVLVSCPRSYKVIPCNDYESMIGIWREGVDKVYYRKYLERNKFSVDGLLVGISVDNGRKIVEPFERDEKNILGLLLTFSVCFLLFASICIAVYQFLKNRGS